MKSTDIHRMRGGGGAGMHLKLQMQCNILTIPFCIFHFCIKVYYPKLLQDLTFILRLQIQPFKLQRVNFAGIIVSFDSP